MLRSNGSDPNRITFILDLQADPRYRQQIQAIKKDVVQAQQEMFKGEQTLDARRTQVLERGEQRRATVRKTSLDRMIAEEERALNRLDAQLARIEAQRRAITRDRVIGNVLDSAGVRNAADEARANFYKRRQEKERQDALNDRKMEIVWSEAANRNAVERIHNEQRLQQELRRTADIQRRHFSQAGTGFRQTGAAATNLATGVAAVGAGTGGNFDELIKILAIGGGTLMIGRGLADGARGITNLANGLGGIVKGSAVGAGSFYTARSATNIGFRTLGGLAMRGASRIGAPAWLAYEAIQADEAGYQAMLAREAEAAQRGFSSRSSMFDERAFGIDRTLARNDFLESQRMLPAWKIRAGANQAVMFGRQGASDALYHFDRAASGIGTGENGRDIRLSPQAQMEHMQRYADEVRRSQQYETDGMKRILDMRLRERETVAEIGRLTIDGLSRASGMLRDQLATERERMNMRANENKSFLERIGTMSGSEFAKYNRNVGQMRQGNVTGEQLQDIIAVGGDPAERAKRLAEARGQNLIPGTNIDAITGPRTFDVLNRLFLQVAAGIAEKAEGNARSISDALDKAMKKRDDQIVEAIVQMGDQNNNVLDRIKQKLQQKEAVMQQAEK